MTGRFAPSTTGPTHPGTLYSALLAWSDAQKRRTRFILRLEDLDRERSHKEHDDTLRDDLAWFGLGWDLLQRQSEHQPRYEASLDRLAAVGHLYPSNWSRKDILTRGRPGPGGPEYPNAERKRTLPAGGWRASDEPIRVNLQDVSGVSDPIVVRRDGAIAYHLASVVDDATDGVTHIVRGRDLQDSEPVQRALAQLLGYSEPRRLYHGLLVHRDGEKLSKSLGHHPISRLRKHMSPTALRGVFAQCAGYGTFEDVSVEDWIRLYLKHPWPGHDTVVALSRERLVATSS